jgi:uncharacterized protein (UPF0335 family)
MRAIICLDDDSEVAVHQYEEGHERAGDLELTVEDADGSVTIDVITTEEEHAGVHLTVNGEPHVPEGYVHQDVYVPGPRDDERLARECAAHRQTATALTARTTELHQLKAAIQREIDDLAHDAEGTQYDAPVVRDVLRTLLGIDTTAPEGKTEEPEAHRLLTARVEAAKREVKESRTALAQQRIEFDNALRAARAKAAQDAQPLPHRCTPVNPRAHTLEETARKTVAILNSEHYTPAGKVHHLTEAWAGFTPDED